MERRQTQCWVDRFEEQLIRCKGAVELPELDLVAGIDCAQEWIRGRVFQRLSDSPAGRIVKLAEVFAPVGPGLVVGDDAVTDCGVLPRTAQWARFVAAGNLVREAPADSA